MNQNSFLLGPEITKPRRIHVQSVNAHLVLGMTPGRARAVRSKFDGNEDACGHVHLDTGPCLLVADAHFGAAASVFVVQNFAGILETQDGSLLERLFRTHLQLDLAFKKQKVEQRGVDPHCSTTLISAALTGDTLYYVSTGDSLILRFREKTVTEINQPHQSLFIGDLGNHPNLTKEVLVNLLSELDDVTSHQVNDLAFFLAQMATLLRQKSPTESEIQAELQRLFRRTGCQFSMTPEHLLTPWHPLNLHAARSLPECDALDLQKGDLILMITDGIQPMVSGLDSDDMSRILQTPKCLEHRVEALLKAMIQRGGGADNCALVAYQHD